MTKPTRGLNYDFIREMMFKRKITGVQMAKKLSLSNKTFYLKINGKREFTATEIGIMVKVLETEANFFYN